MATASERAKTSSDEQSEHSGRLLLRMPPALHGELARAAQRDGSSLNAYITRALSETVRGGSEPRSGSQLLRYAIIADLVIVALAAVAAVALLIAAA